MTLIAAWIRKNATLSELVIATDSRVTGGEVWDWCPKVMPLARPSTLVAVAGDMTTAYAFLLQSVWVTMLQEGNTIGRLDIDNFVAQVDRVLQSAGDHRDLSGLPAGTPAPEAQLIIGGWSWRKKKFRIWALETNRNGTLIKIQKTGLAGVVFAGSGSAEARRRWLKQVRARKDPEVHERVEMNPQWEPLQILRDMSLDVDHPDVGGVPQIAVAYQYPSTESFLVEWIGFGGETKLWCGGRPLGIARTDLRAIRMTDGPDGNMEVTKFFPEGISPRDVNFEGATETVE